ncbi:hypothetical protein HPB47_017845 [Ixodes persulcatus]|uniref:Uncharacterized protein n=1 Tax=Ixodes persulcatus TaxID=34615 RepID=A0AC60QM95_IXOPE|nr:hypothetical protein HPB47_017845 [Ixodes persulcatus]
MLESAITGCMERMLTMLQSRCSRLAQGTSNPFNAWPHYTRVTGNITRPDTEAMINEDGSESQEKEPIPVIEHDTGISTVEHVLIEIICNMKRDGRSVFVLNVYSSPAKRHRFAALFRATLEIAKQQAVVVVGDFNAPHPERGYLTETVKGRNLWHDAHDGGLTMITDPDQPTRRGDARHRDTTPDLAFVRNVKGAEWINTWEDLGSDHFVAAVTVIAGPGKPKGRRIRITEWDAFRGFLEEFEEEDIENIEEWTEELRACAESATKTVPEEANMLTAGSKVLHMWEAKSSMQRRLRIQRHNRNLRLAEKSKLECIVRKAYKRALGLPDSTSNEKLAALGVHNTIDSSRLKERPSWNGSRGARLAGTSSRASASGMRHRGEKVDVPLHIREMLQISPIPKHMHPLHDAKRREARAKALGRTLKEGGSRGRGAMAVAVVNGDGHLVASCSVKTDDPERAEEVAVALALSMPAVRTIVCDSQSAVRNFAKGRVSPKTLRVLRGATCFGGRERVRLAWTPAHASLPGNEEAHDAARGLTVRAGTTSGPAPVASSGRDRLVTFRDILDHYTDGRRRFPPAHHSLNKRQSTVWRRLQTNTYPCPALLNRWYPDRYTGACKLTQRLRDEESWETTLLSSDLLTTS